MNEEMVEDAMNEEEVGYTFTAYEIDLDYEFDAAGFFDFERDEAPLETRQAELWFDSAGSYPPSPFVAKLVHREEMLIENINISPKFKVEESTNMFDSNSEVEADRENPVMEMNYGGSTFFNHMENNVNSENQTKLSKKPTFPRASTLMKPTASQLAKQHRPFQNCFSRLHTSVFRETSKNSASSCVIENQPAKRQKLEGGLLRKVMGSVQLQQTDFVHKVPKQDGFLNGSSTHTKLRLTIPKDPDLVTAHRAQRAKSSKDEKMASNVQRFKALPLNRKILEAPSLLPKRSTPHLPDFQEFHLKTSERAMQHSTTVLKSVVPGNHSAKDLHRCRTNLTTDYAKRETGRHDLMNNASKTDGCPSSKSFKALPLNMKILTSKGDIGMLRNIKKETTVPREFNFHTEKRFHDNPPVELFNKLSLAYETRVTNSECKAPRSITSMSAKGSKENRWGSLQQANEIKPLAKDSLCLKESNYLAKS